MRKTNSQRAFLKGRISFFFLAFFLIFLAFTNVKKVNEDSIAKGPALTQDASPNVPVLKNVECLSAAVIRSFGCDAIGVDQATITVRPDGSWDFWVHYCCNKSPQSCSKSGKGYSTAPGSLKHEEWSINAQTGCLELRVKQTY